MIVFDNVTFRFDRRVVLEGLSFTALPGQCTVLAGPNGIGKSTALALAAGSLRPNSGSVTCSGAVGYCPQEAALFADMTVLDNLRFFASAAGAAISAEPILPIGDVMRKRVGKLSGGMQKRVSLVCAELGSPQILLLDEPCAGLDAAAQQMLFGLIRQWKAEGRTILYAGHNAAELEAVCDRLVLLGSGGCRCVERGAVPDIGRVLNMWLASEQA